MLNARLRVLAITLAQQHAWRAEGWQIPVSINVSARCIRNPEFALVIRQVLKTWDGDAGQLAVRDPGECAGQEPDRGLADARADRRSGVRLALDDFGTSPLSLSSLRKLPVQVLKIDRCFVAA
jgi:EAL domain-containing protein (putative c-di-GMP-specific phosphodiesterase class I)